MSMIFNMPFFPCSLLNEDGLESLLDNPSISPELKAWAQILNSAESFDDAKLQSLPLTLPEQPDLLIVKDLGQLFDERTACYTSFSR